MGARASSKFDTRYPRRGIARRSLAHQRDGLGVELAEQGGGGDLEADLLPHLHFDLDKFLRNLEAVNPGVRHILTSAATGRGVDEWCEWLAERRGG